MGIMKRWKTVGMVLGICSLFALGGVVATSLYPAASAAQGEAGAIGRYQISAWASYSGERVHHSGYYVLDTVTGKIVDSGHEIHGIRGGSEGGIQR